MQQSERIMLLIILALCAGVFFILYLLLGGDDSSHTTVGPVIEVDDYEGAEDEGSERTYVRKNQVISSGAAYSGISFSSGPAGDSSEPEKPKFNQAVLDKFTRVAKVRTVGHKQKKLKARLERKGFKNEAYIEMRLLALDDKLWQQASDEVEGLLKLGDYEQAIEVLEDALAQVPEENTLLRLKLISNVMKLGMGYGFPSSVKKHVPKMIELMDKQNRIKRETILMDNPLARQRLEEEAARIALWKQNEDAFGGTLDEMKKNKGFTDSQWAGFRAAFVKQEQTAGLLKGDDMRNSYSLFKNHVDKHWADPK